MNAALAQRRLARARQHLKAARDLLAHDDLVDAVSRAYYAIFQAARALLATRDLDSRKHSGIIALFNRHFVKSGDVDRRFGVILKEARRAQEQADYDELSEFTVEDVRAHRLEGCAGTGRQATRAASLSLDMGRLPCRAEPPALR